MLQIELFLPGHKTFDCDWGECREFRSFEDFFDLFDNLLFFHVGFSFNKVLNDPNPDFLNDIVNDGLVSVIINDVLDLFGDFIQIVPGDACNWFDFVSDGRFGVGLGVLEMQVELVLELVFGKVRSDEYVELVGSVLLDDMELIQVNVGQNVELVLLNAFALDLSFLTVVCHFYRLFQTMERS